MAGVAGRGEFGEFRQHRGAQRVEAGLAHRLDQVGQPVEVPVGGVGGDADPARRLAQHDRVGPVLADQADRRRDQGVAQIAVVVAIARFRIRHAERC